MKQENGYNPPETERGERLGETKGLTETERLK
jgi:hypothetical protein